MYGCSGLQLVAIIHLSLMQKASPMVTRAAKKDNLIQFMFIAVELGFMQ